MNELCEYQTIGCDRQKDIYNNYVLTDEKLGDIGARMEQDPESLCCNWLCTWDQNF